MFNYEPQYKMVCYYKMLEENKAELRVNNVTLVCSSCQMGPCQYATVCPYVVDEGDGLQPGAG
jgi:hypothetical protein